MALEDTDRALDAERSLLERATRLQRFHWVVVGASLLLTFTASGISKHLIDEKRAARFQHETRQVTELIAERMAKYEDALWAGVSLLQSHDLDVDHPRWTAYAASIRLGVKYPGINGIGVIHRIPASELANFEARQRVLRPEFRVHPAREAEEHLAITFIEPVDGNAEAIGLDIAFETNRRVAAARARDSATSQITAPITLVQDEARTAGFLFYAPFYRESPSESLEERRDSFAGLVYAPFVVRKLMEGTLEKAKRDVAIRISDGGEVIYDELHASEPDFDPDPAFRQEISREFYGRPWTIEMWSGPGYRAHATGQPLTILLAGLAVDLMLLLMFVHFSRANRRALAYADAMTSDLSSKAERLRSANQDLEKISFLASHDLKTPVRGIANVVGFMQEDCKDVVDGPLAEYVERILALTRRMNELLDDLFAYSCLVNQRHVESEWVDLAELIGEIEQLNDLEETRIHFHSEVEGLAVPPVLLRSILNNLVVNAVKHGGRTSHRPVVEVGCRRVRDGEFEFSVRDYGAGVPEDKREMVFEMFKQLQNRDAVGGSGVGLAVVKHVVTRAGGRVWVEAAEDGGACFRFTWPERYPADL